MKNLVFSFSISLLFLLTIATINALKNSTLIIFVTPKDSIVTINGKNYTNGTYKTFPLKNASAKISAAGFEDKFITINSSSNSTAIIQEYLVENDNKNYYQTHTENYEMLKLIAKDDYAFSKIETIEKILSIKDYLPITKYTILSTEESIKSGTWGESTEITDASNDETCNGGICLKIATNTNSIDTAAKLLADKGFNLSDYQYFLENKSSL